VEPSGPFAIGDVMRDYLDWLADHRKASTAREFGYMARAHILPALGQIQLADLTAARLSKWHRALAKSPARLRTRPGAEPRYRDSPDDPEAIRARRATANRILTVLKAALNRAFEDGKVPSEEAWRRVKPFRGADAARVRYLQEDECRRLLNTCPDDFRRLVRAALLTGCRYGELCRLEVRDFNRDAGTLLVRESKGGKPRWVWLDDEAVAFLATITAGRPGSERTFVRADGQAWGKSHQARPLLEACQAARIDPPASFHILRHTWASHRVMRGMPLLAVAHVLGHADTRMVEKHYGHLAPSYIRDAVRATALDLGPHEDGKVAKLRRLDERPAAR
jgi:integrase